MLEAHQIDRLSHIVGPDNLRCGEHALSLDPGFHPQNLSAELVVSPTTTEQISQIVSFAQEHALSIVPQGGRTGLAGGAVSEPGQIILSTSRLNRILSIDPLGGTMTVEAGVSLSKAEAAASEYDFTVGIDLGARESATIGGMVSTNAGGIEAFRNGVMRQRVLGLEAVLPNGEVFSELRRVVKANEGYDIKQLLIGAEGTVGLVTKVVLDLLPASKVRKTALVACENAEHAVALFQLFRQSKDGSLLSAEIMWPTYARTVAQLLKSEATLAFHDDQNAFFVLFEVEDDETGGGQEFLENILGQAFETGAATNAVVAKNGAERDAIWLIREESFVIDQTYPHGFWFDVSVPHDRLDAYGLDVERRINEIDAELTLYMMGHLGDGNLHLTISSGTPKPAREAAVTEAVYAGLADVGGSFSAEHGIGIDKRAALARYGAPGKLAAMLAIKNSLDPKNIFNPGKLFLGGNI